MEFIQAQSTAKNQIQSYENGALTINHEKIMHSVIVLPDEPIKDWPIKNISELTLTNGEILQTLNIEILLIGTGASLIFPEAKMFAWLKGQKYGVEIMDTAAACRTFQILTAEKRKVAAALIV